MPITLLPFWRDLKTYNLPSFRADLIAAISVALMALPQAMAYAFVAGLPTSAGIWAVIFGTLFTASFGESRLLISGPTNMVAILIQSGTSEILYTFYRSATGAEQDIIALNIVLQLVLIIGVFQIIAGFLRLGRLVQFTSRSVVVGYMAGAALAIIVTQLFPFFGIRAMEGYHPIYQQGWYLLGYLPTLHIPTTLIAIGCLILLIVFYRISKKIPAAVIVFFIAASAVALFNLSPDGATGVFDITEGQRIEKVTLLGDVGPIYSDLPKFIAPSFEMRILTKIVPLAFAITLLGVLEATAIGRSYTSAKEPPYNDNQELYGLGISNVLSSFLGAMPSSGSFSRSALNVASGGKTRFSAIFSVMIVFFLVVVLGFLVTRIPIAALSALLVFTAYTMVNFKHFFICIKATRTDAFVLVVTLISSLLFTLDVALYVGIAVSIVLYLKQAAVPELVEYTFNNIGKLRLLELEDQRPDPEICIVQVEGELFFGAADLLQTKLRRIAEEENLKVIILQLLNTRYLDGSVCLALQQVHHYLAMTHRYFILSGVTAEIWEVLHRSGLLKQIGEENCFPANEQLPGEPTRRAYALAKILPN